MATPQVLTTWKEIAAYMGKGVRTVQRWEDELGLPVRRPGEDRHIVLAFPAELDEWARRKPAVSEIPPREIHETHRQLERMKTLMDSLLHQTAATRDRTAVILARCKATMEKRYRGLTLEPQVAQKQSIISLSNRKDGGVLTGTD